MAKLIMLKGLPGSGKSTWAREYISSQPILAVVRVNKDDLRAMMFGGWCKGLEKLVIAARDNIVLEALSSGTTVIVDDTNFNPIHEKTLRKYAETLEAEFELKYFHTPITECIARDALRPKPVGEAVIRNMAKQYGV